MGSQRGRHDWATLTFALPPKFQNKFLIPIKEECLVRVLHSNRTKWIYTYISPYTWGFPDSSIGKESACNAGDTGSVPGSGRSAGEGIGYPLQHSWASLVDQLVNNLPATWETWVRSLGWEDPPGEGKGYPLQYSGLENSINCIVHGVTESRTWLSGLHFHRIYIDRESEIFIMSDWLRSARNCCLKAKWPRKLVVVFQAKSKGLWPKGTDGMSPTQIWRPEKQKCWYPRAGEDGCSN